MEAVRCISHLKLVQRSSSVSQVNRTDSNNVPLGCGRVGDSPHEYTVQLTILSNCLMQSCQQGKEPQMNVCKTFRKPYYKILRHLKTNGGEY